ncbi:MAG: glycoside hydrolase family 95 protein [Niameybacter sp.]|uniref:glycoside hydrolase family 95 protein n=1 Tax=Niameybacter sp. TaxID=2033640 RepID=UPI002FCB2B9D
MNTLKLWYKQPSPTWTHSLPLGNGHLGAMVDGGISETHFLLNEDTLWSGYPRNLHIVEDASIYEEAKKATLNQDYATAEKILEENLLGDWTQAYLPLGDLSLSFDYPEAQCTTDYTRTLNLETATHLTTYRIGDTLIHQESFISAPHDALYIHVSSSTKGFLSAHIKLTSPLKSHTVATGNTLHLDGLAPSHIEPSYVHCPPEEGVLYFEEAEKRGMRFGSYATLSSIDGTITTTEDTLHITGATSFTLVLSAKTSFNGSFKHPYLEGTDYKALLTSTLAHALSVDFDAAKAVHVQDYTHYFNRMTLTLPTHTNEALPTDLRLKTFLVDKSDTGLASLLFHYGRYLMLSSSRPGTQATNLQGIWNQDLRAPWSSNYTVNINTQMNYWPAESCNLSDMHTPLFDLIKDISVSGQETAKKYYNASGFVAHHNIDLWRQTTPVGNHGVHSSSYGFWNLSSGWLSTHLYQHYLYTLDTAFLKEIYPILREAAHFYSDLLIQDENGYYFLPMSTSPENSFDYEGQHLSVCETTTMTSGIVKETFQNCLDALSILGEEDELQATLSHQLAHFLPYKVSERGTLLEWCHDFTETEITHRHVSHLYPLFPGKEFSFHSTPQLMEACKQSLLVRGDDGTGWSLGWKINLWAKLRDGNHALKLIERQLHLVDITATEMHYGGGTYTNLFDAHPPFQIDGNFAATSGITHMLAESHLGQVYLLPALPDKWHTGVMTGFKLKGNITLDMHWENMMPTKVTFTTPITQTLTVHLHNVSKEIQLVANQPYIFS